MAVKNPLGPNLIPLNLRPSTKAELYKILERQGLLVYNTTVVKNKIEKIAGIPSVVAKQDDGTVQITITIPNELVREKKEEALSHITETLEVSGFRKGKVPQDIALKHIDTQKLYEHTLQRLLPEAYADAIEEHKIQPILAPRFELLSIKEDSDWQIRAITCELPKVNLGDYKQTIKGALAGKKIWIPHSSLSDEAARPQSRTAGKDNPSTGSGSKTGGEPTREEKEQEVIKTLIEKTEVKTPKLLIEEEVNHRLSNLLDQVQRLGLSVEQYLASTGKTVDQIREDYAKQAEEAIKLELLLTEIAKEQKIEVSDEEIDKLIDATGDDKTKETLSSPSQKRLIKSTLMRRKALDNLISLV